MRKCPPEQLDTLADHLLRRRLLLKLLQREVGDSATFLCCNLFVLEVLGTAAQKSVIKAGALPTHGLRVRATQNRSPGPLGHLHRSRDMIEIQQLPQGGGMTGTELQEHFQLFPRVGNLSLLGKSFR